MKYKLVKYNEDNIKGYIDINGIYNLYNTMDNKLTKNYGKYLKYIEKDQYYKNLYIQLTDKINLYISKKKKVNYYKKQKGGQIVAILPLVLSGASSSLIVCSVIAYIIFRILTAPKCRPSYPLSLDTVPKFKDIIFKIIPQDVVIKLVPNIDVLNIDDKELAQNIRDSLNLFSTVLEIIAPDSILGQLVTGVVEVVAGVAVTAATAVSAGAATIVNYLLKAFNLLKDAIAFLLKFVGALIDVSEILLSDDTKRVVNDLLNVDFSDGPFGVKCWVEYVMNKYGKNTEFMKLICSLFNKLLSTVYSKLIAFISKAISFAVPEGGITGTLFTGFVSVLKCKTYDFALLRLNKTYDRMSYDSQILFEKPLLMKKVLDNHITNAKGFFDFINSNVISKVTGLVNSENKIDISNIYNFFIDNTYFFAYSINKVFAIVFAMLHILSMCSKQGFCDPLLDQIKI